MHFVLWRKKSVDLAAVLAVVGVVASVLIAWQQGAFRRIRVNVKLGPAEKTQTPWAAFVVVPDLPVSHYVMTVPIQLVNAGADAVNALRLQVQHARAASVLNLNQADVDLYKKLKTRAGLDRTDSLFGDVAISDYEFAVLRREESAMVGHLIAIPKQLLFNGKKPLIWATRIGLQVAAANSRLQLAHAYVVVAGSRDGLPNDAIGQEMGASLLALSRSEDKQRSYVVWKWRDPDKPLETRPTVGIQPHWVLAKPGVALEDQLTQGGEPTQYSSSTVDIVDLTPRAIARRARRQK
jgi:hypothetical protein